jgi:hypothetical protein
MGDALKVPGLVDLGCICNPKDDSLNGPGTERHPDKIAETNLNAVRNAIGKSPFLAARAVHSDLRVIAASISLHEI